MAIFEEPPFTEWRELLDRNISKRAECVECVRAEEQKIFRGSLLRAAREYSSRVREAAKNAGVVLEEVQADESAPIVAAGHQPLIYHPGLMQKVRRLNDAITEWAVTGINFIIDTDEGAVELILPGEADGRLAVKRFTISDGPALYAGQKFDAGKIQGALQSAHVSQDTIGERLQSIAPILERLSGLPVTVANSVLRATAEQRRYLELPLSELCALPCLWPLADRLIGSIWSLPEIYNRTLDQHRKKHSIKNAANPFPSLVIENGRRELPFWIVDTAASTRSVLRLERNDAVFCWRIGDTRTVETAADTLKELAETLPPGLLVVPRGAMVTFIFRTLCCDLFIHGRGGGHYDTYTNALAESLRKRPLPEFVVASATERIFAEEAKAYERAEKLRATFKEIAARPERYLGEGLFGAEHEGHITRLDTERRALIAQMPGLDGEERSKVAHQLNAVNKTIREMIEASDFRKNTAIADTERGVVAAWVSREYPFFLFGSSVS